MLAYFVFTFISYRDRVPVSYYEVEEGSLVKEHKYTGLILREEEIFDAGANGYIYYYVADGRKAAKGSPVYSIDEGGQLMNYLNTHSDELSELDASKVADIRAEMLGYSRSFNDASFRSIYNIKNTLDAHTIEYASLGIFSTISGDLADAGINFKEFYADRTGVVCCYTDGYEGVTEAEINETLFDRDAYNKVTIKAGELVSSGDPAYKMITDEKWELVFPMSQEDIDEFGSSGVLKVSFPDKNFSLRCKFKRINGSDSRPYGVLEMDSYTVQFTSDRFVDFEIVTNDVSGLKIPVKALTTKDLYIIPLAYAKQDANGNRGFYKAVVSSEGTASLFVIPEIFSADDEYYYLDCDDEDCPLKPGDFVLLPEENREEAAAARAAAQGESGTGSASGTAVQTGSAASDSEAESAVGESAAGAEEASGSSGSSGVQSAENADNGADTGKFDSQAGGDSETEGSIDTASDAESEIGAVTGADGYNDAGDRYQIAAKKGLDGVYNVNKGYAVFRRAEVLETANGYSIVKKNTSYGLQVYDHIVLDASMVSDGQLLYR